jgi:hypothetical protein
MIWQLKLRSLIRAEIAELDLVALRAVETKSQILRAILCSLPLADCLSTRTGAVSLIDLQSVEWPYNWELSVMWWHHSLYPQWNSSP